MKKVNIIGKNPGRFLMAALIFILFLGLGFSRPEAVVKTDHDREIKPPKAKKIAKELTLHGHTRVDDYYWLKQRDNPEVIRHLEAENRYKEEVLGSTLELQQKIYNEITGRIKKTDMSVPYKERGYFYYQRFEGEGEYPIFCRRQGSMQGQEEILLDGNALARGHDYFHVAEHSISPDNRMMAFGMDTVSRRKYKIYFKDLETGKIAKDVLENTDGRAVWASDSKTVFYSVKDETLRTYKIFKHAVGTPASLDREIFHETDPTFSVYVFKSKSRACIFIGSFHTLSSEYRYVRADRPDDPFRVIQKREKNLEYDAEHFGDHFYIRTNDRARNFKLVKTPVDAPSKENWIDVIGHREGVLLTGFEIFDGFLVLRERKDGLLQIRVKRWDGKDDYYIDFEEDAYLSYIDKNPEFYTNILRFGYTSLTTPDSIYDYDMNTRQRTLRKRQEIVGDFDPANYRSERFLVAVRDGTRVPVSLVYRKGQARDGSNPLLLYGYGSYGASMDPYFTSVRLSLLDRGFIYAIAHVRGGQEMGRQWYEDGKLLKKKNTFYDFIDCARYLIQARYTCPKKLFAMGGSAGGLLMGAVANLEPEMFRGIIAAVPWVDVVTTMLDDSIPLTTAEYDEWGNPRNEEYYQYMLSYSPYDNVGTKPYPALLVTTGYHDSQVQYFEPAKWVQKLREMSTSKNKILLHVNMEGGHGGISGRFRRQREAALTYAFMLDLLDIHE